MIASHLRMKSFTRKVKPADLLLSSSLLLHVADYGTAGSGHAEVAK